MSDREEFLGRVRAALGPRGSPPPPPDTADELLRLASTEEDLLARFAREAESVGMEVERSEDAAAGLVTFLQAESASRVLLGIADAELRASVEQGLGEAGIECVNDAYDCDAGVTDAHAALAESGTLLLHPGSHQSRGASLAPLLHVVLLESKRVLADMLDYFAQCDARERGARILVTGPSKTADIEGELVQGVHGPGRVRILLIS
jgi:L-lactate dehydrogenase complex protein LldG